MSPALDIGEEVQQVSRSCWVSKLIFILFAFMSPLGALLNLNFYSSCYGHQHLHFVHQRIPVDAMASIRDFKEELSLEL
ncbi:hypothetical protein H5410_023321 [Solanum commersonii]|uniref:Uncharacterized protein n=1 Tax=Solanum commersonii TaxID=4109 RepID=A0A9J5ZJ44_SOLCO|nr:hypothetical protein H5410_023321 [Solanum commersonii]